MPIANNLAVTSLALSIAIGGIALALGLLQWSQRQTRDAEVNDADRVYFIRQDWRRAFGVLLMLIIAVGIYVGSRIPPLIPRAPLDPDVMQAVGIIAGTWVEPSIERHANPRFLTVWLVVITLLVTLLGLALFDWIATRRYAHRLRRSMALERIEILRETFRRADTDRNGHAT
jgi:hypothetical protein